MSEDVLDDFARERAKDYVEIYLPSWALEDWTENDTNFLRVYIRDCIASSSENLQSRLDIAIEALEKIVNAKGPGIKCTDIKCITARLLASVALTKLQGDNRET